MAHAMVMLIFSLSLSLLLHNSLPLQTSKPMDSSPEAEYSSKVLNEVSSVFHQHLSSHPINVKRACNHEPEANIVLLRGPGERINVPTFEEIHGMKPFMIAPTCIIAGLGMSLGFDLVKAPGATGDYHTNLISKAETALHMLGQGEYDFAFVHVKAVDDAGHDRDVAKKVEKTRLEPCHSFIFICSEGLSCSCSRRFTLSKKPMR